MPKQTRATWFKDHVLQPTTHNRYKHDVQIPANHKLKVSFWNTTGLLEAGKIHTLHRIMKKQHIDIMILTETHLKEPDKMQIKGYQIFHSADTVRDNKGKPKQMFTGVSIIVAPSIAPALIDLRPIHGRILTATFNTALAPLKIIAAYGPHNER